MNGQINSKVASHRAIRCFNISKLVDAYINNHRLDSRNAMEMWRLLTLKCSLNCVFLARLKMLVNSVSLNHSILSLNCALVTQIRRLKSFLTKIQNLGKSSSNRNEDLLFICKFWIFKNILIFSDFSEKSEREKNLARFGFLSSSNSRGFGGQFDKLIKSKKIRKTKNQQKYLLL